MSMANAKKYMLAKMKTTVMALQRGRLKPSDLLSPMTQQGSISPAITREIQAREIMCPGRNDFIFAGILDVLMPFPTHRQVKF
jgi:hypothetical protein